MTLLSFTKVRGEIVDEKKNPYIKRMKGKRSLNCHFLFRNFQKSTSKNKIISYSLLFIVGELVRGVSMSAAVGISDLIKVTQDT